MNVFFDSLLWCVCVGWEDVRSRCKRRTNDCVVTGVVTELRVSMVSDHTPATAQLDTRVIKA